MPLEAAQQHERELEQALALRRIHEYIAEMERGLRHQLPPIAREASTALADAGLDPPAPPTIAPSESASRIIAPTPPKRRKAPMLPPKKLQSKARRDVKQFLQECESEFNWDKAYNAYPTHAAKLELAEAYLAGEARTYWEHRREELGIDPTWSEFRYTMENADGNAYQRDLNAWHKWFRAEQQPGQSVTAYEAYINRLFEDMNPEEQEAITETILYKQYYTGILHEIRARININANKPRTSAEVLALARAIEADIKYDGTAG